MNKIEPIADRYISNILKDLIPNKRGCCLYTGGLDKDGYGRAETGQSGIVRIHVYVLEKKLGRRILPGLCALHTCDVRSCVSEEHLYEGTAKQNAEDRSNRGRSANNWPGHKGEKHSQSVLTEEKVRTIRNMYNLGKSQDEIARIFRVSQTTVSCAIRRKTWSHVS